YNLYLFLLRLRSTHRSPPFPYTTLFRSGWSGTTLPWMSIGYETLMTPMQQLAFYNAVANDGVMVKPRFVSEIRRNGKLVRALPRSEEHTSELQSRENLVCRLLLEKKTT